MMYKTAIFVAGFMSCATGAYANGAGESSPYGFRSVSEFQILLNAENARITTFGSGGGLGSQTGNTLSINISGNGNNTIDLDQDNSGDQTIQRTDTGGNNSSAAPAASPLLNPPVSNSTMLN